MLGGAIEYFDDLHEYQSAIRASNVAVLATAPGDFQSTLVRMDFDRLWMRSGRSSLPYLMRGAWLKDRVVISFLTGPEPGSYHHNGHELLPGALLANPLGGEFYRRSTGAPCGSMSLSPEAIAAASESIVGREFAAPKATLKVQPPKHWMARLLSLYASAEHLAHTGPGLLAHPQVARALEQELILAMIRCLTDGTSVSTDRPQRQSVMRRFQEIIEQNPGRPLYVAEICAAMGVSDRTLRLHCLEQLGMSPHRYLWLRRMYQTRRALVISEPGATTVTDIATEHGFWELGRFSVTYRRLFAEPPSATLRRMA